MAVAHRSVPGKSRTFHARKLSEMVGDDRRKERPSMFDVKPNNTKRRKIMISRTNLILAREKKKKPQVLNVGRGWIVEMFFTRKKTFMSRRRAQLTLVPSKKCVCACVRMAKFRIPIEHGRREQLPSTAEWPGVCRWRRCVH